jgi:hypothetical protein
VSAAPPRVISDPDAPIPGLATPEQIVTEGTARQAGFWKIYRCFGSLRECGSRSPGGAADDRRYLSAHLVGRYLDPVVARRDSTTSSSSARCSPAPSPGDIDPSELVPVQTSIVRGFSSVPIHL